jgi:exopolysaccharide biosynthesis polyprenyl glycosylphosphotransferase
MVGRIRRDNLRSLWLHRILDVGINWLALILAYLVKEGFTIGVPTEPVTPHVAIHTFVVVALIWLIVCSAMETYTYKRRLFAEIVNLAASLALTIAFFNTYVYFARPFDEFIYPRYGMVFYALFGTALLVVARGLKHIAQRHLHRQGYCVRRVLIVGTRGTARRLARACRENHSLGYRFLGHVAGPDEPETGDDLLGRMDQLEDVILRHGAQEVIVALPGHHHQTILEIAHRCQAHNIRLRVVPDLFEVVMIRASLSEIDDIPLIGLRDPVITGYQSVVKRLFDIAIATFCLVLAAPLFVLIPLMILIEGRGRVFFSQLRVGENGRLFRMYKFRSMVEDAEQRLPELIDISRLPQPAFKLADDPRVTPLGKLLRRTSLDELPQLINVLKGDMSMVGPRPEEVQVVQHYELWHRRRLSIKPGITGPMQVSGRGELPLDERIRLELMYISRYSIIEDVKYLLKTIPAVCRARGAY